MGDGYENSTWLWDGVEWTSLSGSGPAARGHHAMAYDLARKDTWEWDGRHWLQIQDMGPSERLLHALVFDPGRKRSLLFGGSTNESPFTDLGDTWEFGQRSLAT